MPASRNPFEGYEELGSVNPLIDDYDPTLLDAETKDVLAESEEPRSLGSFIAIAVVIIGLLTIRLIDLQIIQGTQNRVLAEGNRIRSREVLPPRGEILDRNGVILATNTAAYSLKIYPAELPRKREEWTTLLDTVAAVTQLDITDTRTELAKQGLTSLSPIVLADDVPRETALVWEIHLADLPGVSVHKLPRRVYPNLPGLSQAIGYIGRVSPQDTERWPQVSLASSVGKAGLELKYETNLQGVAGQEQIEVDAKGRVERILARIEPRQGDNLTLSIDARFQESLTKHLIEAVDRRKVSSAAAVVLDVATGEILATVSLPGYDPNVFVDSQKQAERQALLSNAHQPLLNRVTSGTYPAGSTIKPMIATAALSEGTVTGATKLDTSSGVIEIGEFRFPDWKVHGVADVRRAIAESNDIFFYALGGGYEHIPGLGPDRMRDWLKKFGFGAVTGIDLPGETRGNVPDDAWKRQIFGERWYIGDSYHLAIGQGYFLSTPLQLATATAAIANGGTLYQPHLLKSTQSTQTGAVTSVAPEPNRTEVASGSALAIVREGMRQTVVDGTARSLGEVPVPVAGKTGTAQFGKENKTHSWFVGFAPYDTPEIAVAILVEAGGESSDAAVPAAKEFLKDWAALANTSADRR